MKSLKEIVTELDGTSELLMALILNGITEIILKDPKTGEEVRLVLPPLAE